MAIRPNVAGLERMSDDVRFTPESGHSRARVGDVRFVPIADIGKEVYNARERLLKRQAEPHRGDDREKYCKEHNFH